MRKKIDSWSGPPSAWSSHVLPMSVWLSLGLSFLPHPNALHVKWRVHIVPVGVSVGIGGGVCSLHRRASCPGWVPVWPPQLLGEALAPHP